jgi:hypothetical protein
MPLKHDRLTYLNSSVVTNSDTTFFTFIKKWDEINDAPIPGYEGQYFFMSKTKISYVNSNTQTKRLSLEHYCNFSISPQWIYDIYEGVDKGFIGIDLLPSGSNTIVVAPDGSTNYAGSVREEYDLTSTTYFPHLQYPDYAPIAGYFTFWIKAKPGQNSAGGNLHLSFGMYSPNETGTVTADTDLYYGI